MDLNALTKDELAAHALERYGVTLDRKRKFAELMAEVVAMATPTVMVETVDRKWPPPFFKNKRTGVLWDYRPLLEGNPDLEPNWGE
jgi:hypothetical protein